MAVQGSPREVAQLYAVEKRCGPAANPAIDNKWQQGSHSNMTQIPKAPTLPAEAGLLQTRHEVALLEVSLLQDLSECASMHALPCTRYCLVLGCFPPARIHLANP